MGRRRSKRRGSSSGIESLVIAGLFICLLLNAIVHKIDEIVSGVTVIEGLLILLLVGGSIFIYMRLRKRRAVKSQEQLKMEQKRYLKRNKEMNKLRTMNAYDFEEYIATLYRLKGYEASTTKRSGDGGKDIILRKGSDTFAVECKRYISPKVTRPDIQKFHSAMIDVKAKEGFYVTTGEFTKPAMEYILNKPIQIIDGEKLLDLIEEVIQEEAPL